MNAPHLTEPSARRTRQTDRQTGRQAGKTEEVKGKGDRQTDRQTDKTDRQKAGPLGACVRASGRVGVSRQVG